LHNYLTILTSEFKLPFAYIVFSARQHIHVCLARYMLSPVRMPVRPSVRHTGVS